MGLRAYTIRLEKQLRMDYIDKIILEHISINYRFGIILNDGQMLAESHGNTPNIDKYASGIISIFREKIFPYIKDGGTYAARIKNPGELGDFEKFFDSCDIGIIASIRDGSMSWQSAYDQNESYFSDRNSHVKISLSCAASTQEQLESLIATNFSHEISHAYEDFQRSRHMVPSIKNITSDSRYMANLMAWKFGTSSNQRILGKMFYWLNEMELKAIIGQISTEIKGKSVKSPKEAFEAVKTTNAYSIFKKLWQNVSYIENCDDDMTRIDLLSGYKLITGKEVNWETFVSEIEGLWSRWKRKFLQNAGKIAYDYYCETQAPMVNSKF